MPVISSCSTPTISLAKARELNAVAMENRAAELKAMADRDRPDSSSDMSTPDLSVSKESEDSELHDKISSEALENFNGLNLADEGYSQKSAD